MQSAGGCQKVSSPDERASVTHRHRAALCAGAGHTGRSGRGWLGAPQTSMGTPRPLPGGRGAAAVQALTGPEATCLCRPTAASKSGPVPGRLGPALKVVWEACPATVSAVTTRARRPSPAPRSLFQLGCRPMPLRADRLEPQHRPGRAGAWLPWARVAKARVQPAVPVFGDQHPARSTAGHPAPRSAHCGCGKGRQTPRVLRVWVLRQGDPRTSGTTASSQAQPLASRSIQGMSWPSTTSGWAGWALGKLETLPKARRAGPPESRGAVGEASQVLGSGKLGPNGRLTGVRPPLPPRQQCVSADAAVVTDHRGQTRTRGPR